MIYNKDVLEVVKEIKNESIDMIFTDPPYLINYKTNHRKNKKHKFCKEIEGDNNVLLIDNFIKEAYRILKNDTAMYICCSWKTSDIFKSLLTKHDFKIKNQIIWVKNNWTAGDLKGQFGQQYEIVFLAVKGKPKFNGKRITDVWNFNRVSGNKQLHQNEKPVELVELCIQKHSKENDLVFDGFAGVGTTGIACKKLNRKYILCEIDKEYFNIMKNRLESND
jgi:site-specific DNA-methyltransferase (adenine-specific)